MVNLFECEPKEFFENMKDLKLKMKMLYKFQEKYLRMKILWNSTWDFEF